MYLFEPTDAINIGGNYYFIEKERLSATDFPKLSGFCFDLQGPCLANSHVNKIQVRYQPKITSPPTIMRLHDTKYIPHEFAVYTEKRESHVDRPKLF